MLNPNAQKWATALRSGDYKQGQHKLRVDDTFCCLGVACDLYAKENPTKAKWGTFLSDYVFEVKDKEVNRDTLPGSVMEWLGLNTNTGGFIPDESKFGINSLAQLNDHGERPFSYIADIITSQPKGLFNA